MNGAAIFRKRKESYKKAQLTLRVAMYPTKSMLDYMTEMQRLFPEHKDDDVRGLPRRFSNQASLFYSPPHQPTMANHSSSSADSTSPETFPELSQHIFDTQFTARRQRPIFGRKIIGNTEQTPPQIPISRSYESDFELSPPNPTWHQEDNRFSVTPRRTQYTPNVYELFPENKDVGFKSPITHSPQQNVSPTSSYAPTHSNTSSSNYSPNNFLETPPRSYQPRFQPPKMAPMISYLDVNPSHYRPTEVSGQKVCTFCRKNGEAPMVYMNHTVRGKIGNRNIVTCPILRSHVCSTCGVSGDNAHTITYCPVLRSNNNGQPLQSTTITLKNTRIKSNGKRRY